MILEDIFNQLSAHMIEGLMFHSQLSDYFGFIGLKGEQQCHKYHYFEENANYRKLCEYYLHHYNKLISELPFNNPKVIPESWYKYTRYDMNSTTRKNAIQCGIDKWVNWEKDTKSTYEAMYHELIALGEISAAQEIKKYVCDVDAELADAMQLDIEFRALDYDIYTIMDFQEEKYQKYNNKLKEIQL